MSGASVPVDAILRSIAVLQQRSNVARRESSAGSMRVAHALAGVAEMLELIVRDHATSASAPDRDAIEHLRATVREVDRLGGLDCCCTAGCTTPRCAAVARLRGLV